MSSKESSGPILDATASTSAPRGDELAMATDAHVDLERVVLPTVVSARLARVLIVAFCLFLALVPVVQIALEASGSRRSQLADLVRRSPTRANLHQFEEDVARNSVFKKAVQPRVQLALSSVTGWGNGKVYIGRDGVLFYRPGINFVTGRGICDPARIRAKRKKLVDAGEQSAKPDPRPAILAFDAACRSAGVHLVLLPVPDKIMVMPEKVGFSAPRQSDGKPTAIVNSDYPHFLADLRSAGVDVYDAMPGEPAPGDSPRFLNQDTHWTPEWMESVAKAVAAHIRNTVALPANGAVQYRSEAFAVKNVGDLVDMLDLPTDQTLFPPQEVTIRRTMNATTGAPWEPEPSADVLLLGDSFANVYTGPQMKWGEAAGFAPTLARHLKRAIDVIAVNGGGASVTRRELARRPEGLTGKRVVLWEFAIRELTDASWDEIPLATTPGTQSDTPSGSSLVIEATIEVVSKVPDPYTVPYPDCLTYTMLHVDRVLEGHYADSRILAVMWAMKNNVWLPPAKYAPGRRLRAKLIPWSQVDERVKTGQRVDDTADYDHRPYFVTEEHGL
jgi:hypothetical protein